MNKMIKYKNTFKHNTNDKYEVEGHTQFKVSYSRKFMAPLRKKRKNEYDANEEARLEKIVFGNPSDIINNLLDDKSKTKTKDDICEKVRNDNMDDEMNSEDSEDESDQNISILNHSNNTKKEKKKPAWIDEDDYIHTVDLTLNPQNHNLSCERPEKLYATYLENKYKLFVGTPKWAKLERKDEADDLDNNILKHSCHLETPKIKNLPKNVIDIKVLKALNKSTHTEGPIITSVEFHPSSTVALVAGTSGVLSLFQVDGHTNNKLHSMQFKKYPISKAIFMKEGTEILLGSQYYPYCHTYDLMNGKTYKFSLPHRITNMKRYEVSPDGKLIALCGRLGEIYLLHSFTKELVGTFRMNSKCRVLAFTPDSKTLISHGDGSEMYIWDLNTRTCINRAIDDGSLSCTSLAVSPSGQFVATGSAQGVVNLYDMKTVLEDQSPAPLKIWMNLVTSVTSLKFNLTSEILTAASVDKYNAFRMMHLPSFTVFSNFPTLQTNIGMSQTINFSPGSGYLSISNRTGSALLYRLRHYGNY
ncbi:PREDICTED: U3 small nucleolar RNA-associated protein 18 homolog isoform X1 [Acromyrmex echinatior]|uniref:U3 small nucleolar RNA-associated protein 18 homolog isoform X1 n=1 Tax=Acromyrmex echinatior TaxID=103372 RepID=UPI000580F902|nr:PREDICTED: U3 small nucleolar RNA-associated protein 18 homolog isoform X1 [Acromyrmex echinatior]XP_011049745.1 PREDICTED: U3 small nucleolar RNA-associated protein 18 homolog isoform X1 [Acromyrmex echinatior]XP_011049746.1 PREDICTED: U3 small nucleolar RNA-associated protein 18 homolog isoform X1 [Acromyrmex echinatior]